MCTAAGRMMRVRQTARCAPSTGVTVNGASSAKPYFLLGVLRGRSEVAFCVLGFGALESALRVRSWDVTFTPSRLLNVMRSSRCQLWRMAKLLAGMRGEGVNLRAAWTFSVNDFLSNFGIVVAGALVWVRGRTWPDLVVGLIVAVVAGYGGVEILRDAARSRREGEA